MCEEGREEPAPSAIPVQAARMTSARFYHAGCRVYQDRFDTRALADRAHELIVRAALDPDQRAFVERRDAFFLATVDADGQPQCSYKGGDPGFVRVVDERTLLFPWYDGNGMYLSAGNIRATRRVGLLFVDFEDPRRLRVNGRADVLDAGAPSVESPGAQLVVRVAIESVFSNCPRYVHRYRKLAPSEYVPRAGREAPIPDWKRLEAIRDVLPERDRRRLEDERRR